MTNKETKQRGRPIGSSNGTYKIFFSAPKRTKYRHYAITVPRVIAETISNDVIFTCEVTSDGILFRPIKNVISPIKKHKWMEGVF